MGGGYIFRDARGRPTYYVRKQLDRRRWDFSTGAFDHESALVEYRRWRANPRAYLRTLPAVEGLHLSPTLVASFLEWSRTERQNSAGWLGHQKRAIAFWGRKLAGLDLRGVDLRRDILPALEDAPGRHHLIAVLKTFYAWLRAERHLIKPHEDPVAGALKVPTSRPEQWTRTKVIPVEDYEAARAHLPAKYRDALDVLAGTGWHTTELERFAASGKIEEVPHHRRAEAAAILLCPITKGGAPLRTAVSDDVAAAARRLLGLERTPQDRGAGPISRHYLNRALLLACERATTKRLELGQEKKVEPFSAGRFRHSVATWAIERGADPASVAAFLGHKSPRTTQRFYATLATPRKVPTLR